MPYYRQGRNAFWKWTGNSGGGDFLRLFDPDGERRFHARMRVHTRGASVVGRTPSVARRAAFDLDDGCRSATGLEAA